MHSNIIDQALNINFTNNSPAVPPTGGAPDTGFMGYLIDSLGVAGLSFLICALLALIAGVVVFCFRKRFSRRSQSGSKTSIIAGISLLALAGGFGVPAVIQTADAITAAEEAVTIDLATDGDIATKTQTTQINLDQDYPNGYIVFAYTDQDNNLYNADKSAFFGPTAAAATIDQLSVNSYGIQNQSNHYNAISTDDKHPTKLIWSENATTIGLPIPITYAAKADSTLPSGTYSTKGAAIHFDVEPNFYKLTYQDATPGGTSFTDSHPHDAAFILQDAPGKMGQQFIEYNTKPDGSGESYQPGDTYTLDYVEGTIYMIYSTMTTSVYNLRYDANGGSGAPENAYQIDNPEFIISEQKPVRPGYTFMGWAKTSTATTPEYQPGGSITVPDFIPGVVAETTLYAVWEANTYTLSYDANGGSGAPGTQTQSNHPYFNIPEAKPVRSGFVFKGWAKTSSATIPEYQPGGYITLAEPTSGTTSELTLYAIWEEGNYSLKYDANGGTGAPAEQIQNQNPIFTISTDKPTRSGYTFKGWATDPNAFTPTYRPGGSVTLADPAPGTTSELTLYAIWEENVYIVRYDANGGSGAPGTQTQAGNNSFTIPTQQPTRPNFTFKGWSTSSISVDPEYQPGATVSVPDPQFGSTSEVTLYAIWQASTYTLHYNANSGTGAPASQTQSGNTTFNISATKPTRTGYAFTGWSKDSSATTPSYLSGGSITVGENDSETTIYAVWQANTHNISYDLVGGSYGDKHPTIGTYDADIEISNPTRTGYTFTGWNIFGMDTNTHYYGDTTSYGNTSTATSLNNIEATHFKNLHATQGNTVTFTATWQANQYTVTFNANNGTFPGGGTTQQVNETYDSNYTFPTSNPTRTGYTFAGWYTAASGGTQVTSGTTVKVTDNTQILYAHWTENTYNLTYSDNGGSGGPGVITQYHNPNFTISSTQPTRSGYTFKGWAESSTATTAQYQPGNSITLDEPTSGTTSNKTLYAVWEAKTYVLKYNANSGTGAPASQTQSGNTTFNISATKPTRTGYTFTGWSKDSSATTPSFLSGGIITVGENDSETTLYAVWQANQYTVTFDHNDGTGVTETKTETYNSNYVLPNNPTRTGYTFQGWYTAASGGTQVTSSTKVTTAGNHTLYAHWELAPCNASATNISNAVCMQDMNTNVRNSMTTEQQYRLRDSRDDRFYYVSKLKDGKVWMTQNLDLNLSTSKTLTPNDTNITSNWTPSSTTFTSASKFDSTTTAPRSLDIGEEYVVTSGTTGRDTVYTSLSACTKAGHSETECSHYYSGNLYNWTAAKATNNSSSQASIAASSTNSICPKGWTLPSANSSDPSIFGTMLYSQGIITSPTASGKSAYTTDGFNLVRSYPVYWMRAGYVFNSARGGRGTDGGHWSATAVDSEYAYGAGFYEESISPRYSSYAREGGQAVRCVAL